MNKNEFLTELEKGLSGLPREDVEERLAFYAEMIDDRTEEGMSEEEAVAGIGGVDEVTEQIFAETPLSVIVREKIKPKRSLKAWEIVLIVLGFPVWFPLLVAAAAVVFSLYVVLWALIICLWAVEATFAACALACIAAAVVYFIKGEPSSGIAMFGAGLALAGLSVLMFYVCKAATKGAAKLTKKIAVGIKTAIAGKEK